jgi:hypothetical protein
MRTNLALSLIVALGIGLLAGCSANTPAVEPVSVSAEGLQGKTIDLPIDSTLNITTGHLAVTDYDGTLKDPSVARFIPGKKTSSAAFDPAIKPLRIGETMITLTTKDGSGQYVTFMLDVVKKGTSTPTP